jgi:hypothetical protein
MKNLVMNDLKSQACNVFSKGMPPIDLLDCPGLGLS